MATLETQYKSYLRDNPDSSLTYDEWFNWFGKQLHKAFAEPDPLEKVCYNCQHLAWSIGVGAGLRCIHPKAGPPYLMIPHRLHTCEKFEYK